MKKILFISHDASRTGAPILLLNLLKWIKTNTKIDFDIFLLRGGVLENEFKKLGKVYKPDLNKIGIKKQIKNQLFRKMQFNAENEAVDSLIKEMVKENYSDVYGNTIVSISVFESLSKIFPNASFYIHVHELISITQEFEDIIESTKTMSIKYIAVSELVRRNLIEYHHITSSISLIYEYLDVAKHSSIDNKRNSKSINKFIINNCGLIQPRKGYDIFIMIAMRAHQKYCNIPFHFKWIGDVPKYLKSFIDLDIKNANLKEFVEFTGELENPLSEYAAADIFLLTSREDAFPLVCLEHACQGIPIICFGKATGITEFIEKDAGVVIPYLDVENTVDTLADLYYNPEKRKLLGEAALNKVQQYDINIQVPKILEIINYA